MSEVEIFTEHLTGHCVSVDNRTHLLFRPTPKRDRNAAFDLRKYVAKDAGDRPAGTLLDRTD